MKKGSYNCHFIGNVNNPKVVLIHGMGFYWEKCFTPIIEALELEYCLIIPELPGLLSVRTEQPCTVFPSDSVA